MKVLVISDNVALVTAFKQVASSNEFNFATFDYKYSSINKSPEALQAMGMREINVKKDYLSVIDNYELVFSAHCKQIFPAELVETTTCINIHPGLNPYNRGWYPQVFSIINGAPVGATVHLMDKEIDHGAIIAQKKVDVYQQDTSLDVYERVQDAEIQLIQEQLLQWLKGDYQSINLNDEGNYNGIEDFNALCKLDLEQSGTLKEHINLLRALSHGNFANAYFYNEQEEKVFINVQMRKDNS